MNQIDAPPPGGSGGRGNSPGTVLPRGHRLGAFTIDGVFGRGASGVTYLAHDAAGEPVALKALDGGVSPAIAAAFRREAEILGLLRHPNIVGLKHAEPAGDPPFIVLEHLGVRSLADELATGDGLPELRPLLFGLLDALDHVHGAGFLHRDVKPGNIALTAPDHPVLVDFGAAGPIGGKSDSGDTQATPGFGALEQFIEGGTEGPWTDLYGVAAVAYRLLTGSTPGSALERAEGAKLPLLARSAKARDAGCPHAVLEAIDRALELPVHRRPQSTDEWRSELNDAWSSVGDGRSRDMPAAIPAPPPISAKATIAPLDDYPPTEEITRVTPPARRARRPVPIDLEPMAVPGAQGLSHREPAAASPRASTGWVWAVVGVVLLAGLGAGGYFVGWPYYLRNIKSEWLVDAGGAGDVRTISEALETAKTGALIEVRPGTYPESLTILRPVTLTGLEAGEDGPAVIVAPETGACLVASAPSGTVSGLLFQGTAPTDAAGGSCIDLQGAITFQENRVEAAGWPAIHIGGGADPVVAANHLTATAAPVLLVDDAGQGHIRDNHILGTDGPGIVVAGASPVIEANAIEGSGLAGVIYDGAAAGRLVDNVIRQSMASGIEIRGRSNPEITGNRIEGAGQAGIFVFDDGRGRIDGNTIIGSAFSGVVIGAGSKPALTGNTITESAEHGVLVLSGGAAVLQANTVDGNAGFGIALEQEATVSMEGNIVSGNRDPQIRTEGIVRPYPAVPAEDTGSETAREDSVVESGDPE